MNRKKTIVIFLFILIALIIGNYTISFNNVHEINEEGSSEPLVLRESKNLLWGRTCYKNESSIPCKEYDSLLNENSLPE